jgi:hypothetical protein
MFWSNAPKWVESLATAVDPAPHNVAFCLALLDLVRRLTWERESPHDAARLNPDRVTHSPPGHRSESGTKWGRLRGQLLVIGGVGEVGVPAVEVVGEVVVEDSGADLEQQVGSAGCPAHLLFFDHAFADDLVDG